MLKLFFCSELKLQSHGARDHFAIAIAIAIAIATTIIASWQGRYQSKCLAVGAHFRL